MIVHKRTRLTPIQREEIYQRYHNESKKVSDLANEYHVSRPTIDKILARGRQQDFSIHKSTNKRFRCLQYGIRRLSKIEKELEERLKRQAKRYNKDYPGQMIHFDSKRLPMLKGQTSQNRPEYLFVAIDDFSRDLYAAILPDKSQWSAKKFLEQVLKECPYTIEIAYSDNGKEFRGDPSHHAFVKLCQENSIEQRFTKVRKPKTNGKAERVIKTIMEIWHEKTVFASPAHRKTELIRFVNFYTTVKPHACIGNMTPMEKLISYFYPDTL